MGREGMSAGAVAGMMGDAMCDGGSGKVGTMMLLHGCLVVFEYARDIDEQWSADGIGGTTKDAV